jgi:hypothetical protein
LRLPLRYRILSEPETVQDLVLACDERFWEGIELLTAGRRGGGIYLLGYRVEMILKSACFFVDGAKPYELVGPRLGPIRSWANRELPGIQNESYHSLWFWVCVLRRKRSMAGRSIPKRLDDALAQRVRRVHGNWVVGMRYLPDRSLQREADSVFGDVNWIRDRQYDWMS